MKKKYHKRSTKTGLAPGSLIHIGEKKSEKLKIKLIRYNIEKHEELNIISPEEIKIDQSFTNWINIDGLKPEILEKFGNIFDIHPLILEDILNTYQRPKMDDLEKYIFIVMKMLTYNDNTEEIEEEQISIILLDNFLLMFQEENKEGDVFEPLRERLRSDKGKIRKRGADYLVYAVLDSIIDNYFIILEKIEEKIDILEEELLKNTTQATLNKLNKIKRQMMFLRRATWPLRDIINKLERKESALITDSTTLYLHDLYDHIIHVIETIENFKDILSQMFDLYLSGMSNKLNEIMKILTIISTIFIPLTFLAGIYGMNFNTEKSPFNMPELNWYYGYPLLLLIMAVISSFMIIYFKRKKWI